MKSLAEAAEAAHEQSVAVKRRNAKTVQSMALKRRYSKMMQSMAVKRRYAKTMQSMAMKEKPYTLVTLPAQKKARTQMAKTSMEMPQVQY